jgi:hypothetical protein
MPASLFTAYLAADSRAFHGNPWSIAGSGDVRLVALFHEYDKLTNYYPAICLFLAETLEH